MWTMFAAGFAAGIGTANIIWLLLLFIIATHCDGRTEMSALDVAAKRVADGRQHDCHYAEGTCPECRVIARSTITTFLDAVEDSQQPISHDAMQTLRAHLGEG